MKIGITGHQDLGDKDNVKWVTNTLKHIIDAEKIDIGITCLAIGADQLYADILFKKNIPYITIIPSKDYDSTFKTTTDKKHYSLLLKNSEKIEQLQNEKPNEEAFYEAGKKVVEMSDHIIAIWNGKKAQGLGGTGDIVNYALNKGKKIIHIHTILRTVKEL